MYKSHLTSRFCKVKLGLKFTSNMVSELIVARLSGLSDHPLSSRYRTIFTYIVPTHELKSLDVTRVFISGYKFHLTSRFNKVELSLKFTFNSLTNKIHHFVIIINIK